MIRGAIGFGLAWQNSDGIVADVWFPAPELVVDATHLGISTTMVNPDDCPPELLALCVDDALRGLSRVVVKTVIANLDDAPADAYDAYLWLHLLSHRLVKPQSMNVTGIFGVLTNIAWTNYGPCLIDNFEHTRLRLSTLNTMGAVIVYGVDKFPRMVDYVVPSGVRIADADRVRLGAYVAEGTTVMHEGFINFNAGTLGPAMVEGRISAGVVVGPNTDIGAGASIMGTLSGGGKEVISIGSSSLVGANAGIGISLGDNCIVEAGLYVTAGTKVSLSDGRTVKAKDLSGLSDLLFIRNSLNGQVEAKPRQGQVIELNSPLHDN